MGKRNYNYVHKKEELLEFFKSKFLKQAREKYGNRFEYDLSNYKDCKSEIIITDTTTGELFKQIARNHLRSQRSGVNPNTFKGRSEEEIFSKIEELFPGQFEFLTPFNGYEKEIEVRCKVHNKVFRTTPKNLYNGHNNCPDCYSELLSKKSAKRKVYPEECIPKIKDMLESGKSFIEIGDELGISGHQAGVLAEDYGLVKPNPIQPRLDKIKELIEKGMYGSEIAREMNLTESCISGLIKRYNLPTPKPYVPENFGTRNIKKIKKLIKSGLTNSDIKKELGCSDSTLQKALKDFGIINPNKPKTFEQKCLGEIRKYIKKGLNNEEIANKLGCVPSTIKKYLKKNNIENPNEKPTRKGSFGENLVYKFLKSKRIKFKEQDSYKGIYGTRVVIDFTFKYKKKTYWIEYNGKQHYRETDHFNKSFEKQLERDNAIRDYCKKNGIILIEVPYTHYTYKKVSEFLDKTVIQSIDQNTLIDYSKLYKTK